MRFLLFAISSQQQPSASPSWRIAVVPATAPLAGGLFSNYLNYLPSLPNLPEGTDIGKATVDRMDRLI